MKPVYALWFFVCSGWGYILALPEPPSMGEIVSAAPAILIVAVVLAAATSFTLVAFVTRGSSPHRTYEAPSLAVKPWVMPVGIMVFVNTTFLFASLWGIIFAAVLPSTSVMTPAFFLAVSVGGIAGLWVTPHVFPSRFRA